jgi:hypothetical protein
LLFVLHATTMVGRDTAREPGVGEERRRERRGRRVRKEGYMSETQRAITTMDFLVLSLFRGKRQEGRAVIS